MKRITIGVFSLLLLSVVLFPVGCLFEDAGKDAAVPRGITHETRVDEKVFWEGTIASSFCDSSVIVMLDKATGGINKEINKRLI